MADVRITLDERAIRRLGAPGGVAHPKVTSTADDVVKTARRLAPRRTGAGAASIDKTEGRDSEGVYYDVGADAEHFYMSFQEEGTRRMSPNPHLRPAAS